jgi:hypothetical protein
MILEGIHRRIWQTTVNEVVEQRDMTLEEARRIWQTTANAVVGQKNTTARKARGIWQRMANEVASNCFDATNNVDVKRIQVWMAFFGNAGNFTREPSCSIRHAELMGSICTGDAKASFLIKMELGTY